MDRSIIPLFVVALAASAPALANETIPVPHFDGVGLRGGGQVVIVPGPVERVTIVEGSSRFTHIYVERGGGLNIEACDRECPREYRLRVEVESPRVPALSVEGGGAISVAPGFASAGEIVAAVRGGGQIDTRAIDAGAVTAAVNGGGDLLVRARSTLTGAVRGGGAVRFWGHPAVTSAIDGGGSIEPGH